jgi:hypothetical protein
MMILDKITDEQKQEWCRASIIRRAEFGGYVYELKDNGKVYMLERNGSAPKKAGEVSHLFLVRVIDEPDLQLRLKINDKAESFFNQQTQTEYQ